LGQNECEFSGEIDYQKVGGFSRKEVKVHRRADRLCLTAGRAWNSGQRMGRPSKSPNFLTPRGPEMGASSIGVQT